MDSESLSHPGFLPLLQTGQSPEAPVICEIVSEQLDVESPGPSACPQNRLELVLIVRLGHEDMSPAEPARYHSTQVHTPCVGGPLIMFLIRN